MEDVSEFSNFLLKRRELRRLLHRWDLLYNEIETRKLPRNAKSCFTRPRNDFSSFDFDPKDVSKVFEYCIETKRLPEKLKIFDDVLLGRGQRGTALQGTFDGKDVSIKFIPLDVGIPWRGDFWMEFDFDDEVLNTRKGSDLKISPQFFFADKIDLATFKYPEAEADSFDQNLNIRRKAGAAVLDVGDGPITYGFTRPKRVGIIVTELAGDTVWQFSQKYPAIFQSKKEDILRQIYALFDRVYNEKREVVDDRHLNNFVIDKDFVVKMIDLDFTPFASTGFPDIDAYKRNWKNRFWFY